MGKSKLFAERAALAMVTACGDTVGKQALYGAAGGADASGAVGSKVAAGALVGAATNVLACDSSEFSCN